MPRPEIAPELADAADVLSDQLRVQLQRMAVFLLPHAAALQRKFLNRLIKLKIASQVRTALVALTPGTAAKSLARGQPPLQFIEEVEYHGRRLAKLNVPPSSIVRALQEYDTLLAPVLRDLKPADYANFRWVREQLHFCVILTLNNAYYQVREVETQAFYELFRVELEARNLDELLLKFLQALVHVCQADTGHLYLLNDDRTSWVAKATASASRRPVRLPPKDVRNGAQIMKALSRPRHIRPQQGSPSGLLDPGWKSRFKSCWSIPLAAEGRTAGVMQFGFTRAYEWLPREHDLLAAAAERCLMAAEKARLMEDLAAREEQVRQLAEHMLHVEEIERRRISRELHDEAGQSLLCIRLQLELIEQNLPREQAPTIAKLREARDLTEHTILEMRRLIAALSPAVLEQLGLGAALRQLVNRFRGLHPCRVKLHLGRLARLPQNTEVILYRLVQECCNNIGKHSAATEVNISVSSADEMVRLIVEDNGIGFKVEEALERRDSFGLSGMRERVALLGGHFEVRSHPRELDAAKPAQKGSGKPKSRGTKIVIDLPLAKEHRRPELSAATFRSNGRNIHGSQLQRALQSTL